MNLATYFFETDIGIEPGAHRVLLEGLDLHRLHSLAAHELKGVLHHLSAETLPLAFRVDGHVRDPANAAVAVQAGRDVAEDLPFILTDEDAPGVVSGDISVDVAQLAEPPVLLSDGAELLLDVAIDGDPVEADRRDLLEAFEVVGAVGANHTVLSGVRAGLWQNRRGSDSCQSSEVR